MKIAIKPVVTSDDEIAIRTIRQQVFEREKGVPLPAVSSFDDSSVLHLLARVEPGGEAVAALSVVDTTGNRELHQRCGLPFGRTDLTARYTQLAVLKLFRGLNIPMMLILEAHRRFIAPGQFDYTWLLFDAEKALSSSLFRWLAFDPSEDVLTSEYGPSRVLIRDERDPRVNQAMRQAEEYLAQQIVKPLSMGISGFVRPSASA